MLTRENAFSRDAEIFKKVQTEIYENITADIVLDEFSAMDYRFYSYCYSINILAKAKKLCKDEGCLEGSSLWKEPEFFKQEWINYCKMFKDEKMFIYKYCMFNSKKTNKAEFCECKSVQQGWVFNLNCSSIL